MSFKEKEVLQEEHRLQKGEGELLFLLEVVWEKESFFSSSFVDAKEIFFSVSFEDAKEISFENAKEVSFFSLKETEKESSFFSALRRHPLLHLLGLGAPAVAELALGRAARPAPAVEPPPGPLRPTHYSPLRTLGIFLFGSFPAGSAPAAPGHARASWLPAPPSNLSSASDGHSWQARGVHFPVPRSPFECGVPQAPAFAPRPWHGSPLEVMDDGVVNVLALPRTSARGPAGSMEAYYAEREAGPL